MPWGKVIMHARRASGSALVWWPAEGSLVAGAVGSSALSEHAVTIRATR
jgi:hypothetical protein